MKSLTWSTERTEDEGLGKEIAAIQRVQFTLPLSVTPFHQHRANTLEKEPQKSRRVQPPAIIQKSLTEHPLKIPTTHEHCEKWPFKIQNYR